MGIKVMEDSIRPAGEPDKCFYCGEPLGGNHKENCVMVQRDIVIEATFRIVVSVPAFWDKDLIEFHFNESSYCADNLIDVLKDNAKERCLCDRTEVVYLGEKIQELESSY